MKPKIAIVIHSMGRGGAERQVSYLLDHLRDQYEIHLILIDGTIEFELPKDQIVTVIDNKNEARKNIINIFRIPLLAYRLRNYCRTNDIDLVLSFLNRPNFISGLSKLFGNPAKLLISEQTHTQSWYPENNLRGFIAKHFVRHLYSQADALLPNSQGTKLALENHYGIHSKYFVIKNIVDVKEVVSLQLEEVDDVSFDRFTFIHVGSFSPMKGHRLMVKALARLETDQAQLVFIGKGKLMDGIKELAEDLGVSERVAFLGHRSNPFKYLSKADCFVLASDFEGFPNVLIEAMVCGLPIISTDCQTGPRELLAPKTDYKLQPLTMVEAGQYGLLVPVGNEAVMAEAMQMMMESWELRNRYVALAAGRSAEYDRKNVIHGINAIIRQFLPENSS